MTEYEASSKHELLCEFRGLPPIYKVLWHHNGKLITDGISSSLSSGSGLLSESVTTSLRLDNVKQADSGWYSCTAESGVGKIEHSAKVIVNGSPWVGTIENMFLSKGETIQKRIYCPYGGTVMERSITWFKNGNVKL